MHQIMRLFIICLGILIFASFSWAQQAEKRDTPGSKDKPVKVLKKPRPTYTDRARQEAVSGIVVVKVEFRADGTIGNVVGVPENSFELRRSGLVDQSIAAARKITFTPASKNGKPVTVIRLLQYTFQVY